MNLENEHENWNVECKKPILVRSTKSAQQWTVKFRLQCSSASGKSVEKWYSKIW